MDFESIRIEFDPSNPKEYGALPRKIARCADIPFKARWLYSYLCTFAGDGNRAYPSVDLMVEETGLTRQTFYEMRDVLVRLGLLVIERGEREGRKWAHNTYHLPYAPTCRVFSDERAEGPRCGEGPFHGGPACEQYGNRTPQSGHHVEQYGNRTPQTKPDGDAPPVYEQCGFETAQIRTAKDGRMDGEDKTIRPSDQEDSLPAKEDGSDPLSEAFGRMASQTLNRNNLATPASRKRTKDALAALASRFPLDGIEAAWRKRTEACAERSCEARFWPQLLRWLENDAPAEIAIISPAKAKEEQGGDPRFEGDEVYAALKRDMADAAKRANGIQSGRIRISPLEIDRAYQEARCAYDQARAALAAYRASIREGERAA